MEKVKLLIKSSGVVVSMGVRCNYTVKEYVDKFEKILNVYFGERNWVVIYTNTFENSNVDNCDIVNGNWL